MLLMIAEILHQLRTVVYPITYSGVLPLVPNSDARMHYRDVIKTWSRHKFWEEWPNIQVVAGRKVTLPATWKIDTRPASMKDFTNL